MSVCASVRKAQMKQKYETASLHRNTASPHLHTVSLNLHSASLYHHTASLHWPTASLHRHTVSPHLQTVSLHRHTPKQRSKKLNHRAWNILEFKGWFSTTPYMVTKSKVWSWAGVVVTNIVVLKLKSQISLDPNSEEHVYFALLMESKQNTKHPPPHHCTYPLVSLTSFTHVYLFISLHASPS